MFDAERSQRALARFERQKRPKEERVVIETLSERKRRLERERYARNREQEKKAEARKKAESDAVAGFRSRCEAMRREESAFLKREQDRSDAARADDERDEPGGIR